MRLTSLSARRGAVWSFGALLCAVMSACAELPEDFPPAVDEVTAPRPFCELSQPATPSERVGWQTTLWSAATVQREIARTMEQSGLRCSPQGAYLAVYARMTAARDAARCEAGNLMRPMDPLDARLNDALSDVMTRNYLEIVRRCGAGTSGSLPDPADPGGLWCELHRLSLRDNRDAVRVATGSTGLYLSAHLALAVSTLPHLDPVWAGSGFGTLTARVERMRAFKPTFDAFNGFLARNLDTVATALGDAGLLRGGTFGVAAGLAERVFPSALAFGRIRDGAWVRGLGLALAIPRGLHPWTLPTASGFTIAASPARLSAVWPDAPAVRSHRDALVREARDARDALCTPLLGALGGHNFVTLGPASSARAACLAR
jgi:hypothetical protein